MVDHLTYKLLKLFPDLTFFQVVGKFNGSFGARPNVWPDRYRIFCSLEKSLSIRSVVKFLEDGSTGLKSIEPDKPSDYYLDNVLQGFGIVFAETGKIYKAVDLEELKRDYFIAKLSGLKQ